MAELSKSWAFCLVLLLVTCCLSFFLPFCNNLAEAMPPPLQLKVGQERYEVGPHLEILPDPDNRFTIETVSSPSFASAFSPVDSPTLNLGIMKTTVWVRFSVSGNAPGFSRGQKKVPWLLDIGWPFFAVVDSYLVRSSAKHASLQIVKFPFSGIYHPFGDVAADKAGIVARLPELSGAEQVIYLRMRSDTALFLHPVVCTVKNYLETSTRRMLWFGIYFGILLALLFYNLFLYFCLRDRSYLWYVISIGSIGLYFLGINRLTYEYLVDFPPVSALRFNLAFLSISLVTLLLFVRSFLPVREKAPLLNRIIWGGIFLQVALTVPVPFAPIPVLDQCYSLADSVLPFIMIAAAGICWRRGYRPARFLLLSWVLYGLSGLVYILTFRGILPFTSVTFHSFQIGSALEAVLLSFALADRINLLRQEREELSRSDRRHRELAITDVLTGLYNLRYFRTQIDIELEQADRQDQRMTLMMLDVDHFKQFNDRFGHQEGDRVLATLGQIMTSCVRQKDVACRYGGEEFAIILPGGLNSTAVEVYERISAELARHHFGSGKGETSRVTLSIGVAEHIPGEGAEILLSRADQALYEAKARGRNQIVIASREPEAAFSGCISEPPLEERSSLSL